MKFSSSLAGYITGIRFYKGTGNTGTHVGSLWTTAGAKLASITFSGETATGWQYKALTTPVAISANTTYVVSYYAPVGRYAANTGYFASTAVTSGPLRALSNSESGGNGVYRYGASAFPNQTWNSCNYWVDVVFQQTLGPDTTPPTISSVLPANGAINAGTGTTVTATFSEAMTAATINASSFALRDSSNGGVAGAVTYDSATNTATLTPSSALTAGATYTARILSGAAGVKDAAGNPLSSDYTWSFTTASAGSSTPYSIWNSTAVPGTSAVTSTTARELGLKFRSSLAGYITGIRFYKGTGNTGTHVGSLWTAAGAKLASITFSGETATGWQYKTLTTPVAISANTTYVVSYYAPVGRYAADTGYFASTGVTSGPLRALSNTEGGGNGVYRAGSGFPNRTQNSTNYWVDVVFQQTLVSDTTPPTVSSVAPANGAINVGTGTTVTATFSEAMDPATISASTFSLLNSSNSTVAATVTYNATSRAATLTPTAPLAAGASYSSTVRGGSTGVKDAAGNPLAVAYSWAFTTAADTVPPTVDSSSTYPLSGSTGVSTGSSIRVPFSENMDPATITSSTVVLLDPSGAVVPATVTYDSVTRTATIDPLASLDPGQTYTVRIVGGATGVADLAGNRLALNYTWSFTTSASQIVTSGAILLVTSSANPFSSYLTEILTAEGLNAFAVQDISAVTDALLAGYDVAVLGEMTLTASQVTMFTNWVTGGGNLIAMRPDKKLAGLLGLTDAGATLSEGYLLADTASGPGKGIVGETIQYHGTADRYTLSGATGVATLYSSASSPTTNPAVSLRSVGTGGGQAAAFTYDLARSIVYTRQGNPAWAGQERDGTTPIRSDDLFYPDWVNLDKVAIPQADEQQRLLANLIIQMNFDKKPLPRFWYFPDGYEAVVVMTGDDHGQDGTAGRFDEYIASSASGCSVDDWRCIRSSSYIYPDPDGAVTNTQAAAYNALGFEIGLHLNTGCLDYTRQQLEDYFDTQMAQFRALWPSLPAVASHRAHCIVWSGYTTMAEVEAAHGIRMDVNYYYWPGSWIANRPGFFTGSGMPMRFAKSTGEIIDVYQATTQMTDESDQSYPYTIDSLLDKAIGPEGYYGAFTANIHTDSASSSLSDAIIASALGKGIPVVSARQLLKWVDGRNGSYFSSFSSTGSTLQFSLTVADGANGLQVMVPKPAGKSISGIQRDGVSVGSVSRIIKGQDYAVFSGIAGNYVVNFAADTQPPTVYSTLPASAAANVAVGTAVRGTFSEAMDPATITGTTFQLAGPGGALVSASVAYETATNTAVLTPSSALAAGTTYTATVFGGTGGVKDAAGNPLASNYSWSFTTGTVQTGGIIGYNGNGSTTDFISDSQGSYINLSRFQASANLNVSAIYARVLAISGAYKCAIYSDNSGTPANLLKGSLEVTNPAAGWQTFTLSSPQAITAGQYYWLAIWSSVRSTSAGIYTETTGGTTRWTGALTYGTWPNLVTTTGGGNYKYCVYAQ